MGKLRILSGKAVRSYQKMVFRILDNGVVISLSKRKTDTSTITVPVPNHKEIKQGTLRSIIRQSQLSAKEFES